MSEPMAKLIRPRHLRRRRGGRKDLPPTSRQRLRKCRRRRCCWTLCALSGRGLLLETRCASRYPDSSVLALSLLLPGLNLAALLCSLRGLKLGEAALRYHMAIGAVLTLYGYLGLHLAGWCSRRSVRR